MRYDRYGSGVKRALREGKKIVAIKRYLDNHKGEGLGLRDAKVAVDKLAELYMSNQIKQAVKCPVCKYDNEDFFMGKGQCPRCLSYYFTSETSPPDQTRIDTDTDTNS